MIAKTQKSRHKPTIDYTKQKIEHTERSISSSGHSWTGSCDLNNSHVSMQLWLCECMKRGLNFTFFASQEIFFVLLVLSGPDECPSHSVSHSI